MTSYANFETNDERIEIDLLIDDFSGACTPVEQAHLLLFEDKRTHAKYIECHVSAKTLVELGTVDVPIDPDDQAEYRANREIVEDHVAFDRMKEDAIAHRTFSNIVAEFTRSFDDAHPLKIIGGQHRFTAIREALSAGVDEKHGVKVYFGLSNDQRIDVQLISNTNIAASTDLFDRMQETLAGPNLRDWCQKVGLLADKQDFADRRARADPITVRAARTFIVNYFRGRKIKDKNFDSEETTPSISKSGVDDPEWKLLKKENPALWDDSGLLAAGKEFSHLITAQRTAFATTSGKKKAKPNQGDFAEKALNFAVLSAWAFVAGVLHANSVRLTRHFSLAKQTGHDPLNAGVLAKGRHKTDAENYRGLGYRTDAKERGRIVELFFLQAEDGCGITSANVDVAIKKFHAKEALLEVKKAEAKAKS